jgi:hypothetical protein
VDRGRAGALTLDEYRRLKAGRTRVAGLRHFYRLSHWLADRGVSFKRKAIDGDTWLTVDVEAASALLERLEAAADDENGEGHGQDDDDEADEEDEDERPDEPRAVRSARDAVDTWLLATTNNAGARIVELMHERARHAVLALEEHPARAELLEIVGPKTSLVESVLDDAEDAEDAEDEERVEADDGQSRYAFEFQRTRLVPGPRPKALDPREARRQLEEALARERERRRRERAHDDRRVA